MSFSSSYSSFQCKNKILLDFDRPADALDGHQCIQLEIILLFAQNRTENRQSLTLLNISQPQINILNLITPREIPIAVAIPLRVASFDSLLMMLGLPMAMDIGDVGQVGPR